MARKRLVSNFRDFLLLNLYRNLISPIVYSHFFSPYYIINLVSVLSFFLLESIIFYTADDYTKALINKWDRQSILAIGITIAIKLWQSTTLDEFFNNIFFYVQALILVLSAILDTRILCLYFLLFSVIFILCPQPFYSSDSVTRLTPRNFISIIEEKEKSLLVEFYTPWSLSCIFFSPTFSELELKYSHSGLQFARLDLKSFPEIANLLDIDTSVFSNQLPTLIMFEGGKDTQRMPNYHSASKQGKANHYSSANCTMKGVIQTFGLDYRLIRARKNILFKQKAR